MRDARVVVRAGRGDVAGEGGCERKSGSASMLLREMAARLEGTKHVFRPDGIMGRTPAEFKHISRRWIRNQGGSP